MQRLKKSFVLCLTILTCVLYLVLCAFVFAQDAVVEITLDVTANTTPLPKIYKPNIDLSGRGFSFNAGWPQGLAAAEVLEAWKNDIGFPGIYRLQYNLWEINQLIKDKEARVQLLNNYEKVIREISDAGGTVILDIFGTPAGLGKVLDKKSPPRDLKTFKELVKSHIRNLSCNKRYNIWYEVWSAPDLGEFFLGRKQEYFNLYRAVAESVRELEAETKLHIPVGGPSVSWWFQGVDGNTIATPEKSLIYELIKFCYSYRLPLDFISWHGYSTSPSVEQEATKYHKTAVSLIRDWLFYFHFDRNTPLIVDEWNYDDGLSLSPNRRENSFVCASYIPSRLQSMHKAGIDQQVYFCLEDFFNKDEGVVRNVGLFWFDEESREYKGAPKPVYNIFRFLGMLGSDMLQPLEKINDDFLGVIAAKKKDEIALIIYNYIDADAAKNYLSANIATLTDAERKMFLNLAKADRLDKIIRGELDVASLRLKGKLEALLKKARELNDKTAKYASLSRNVRVNLKNLEGYYLYKKYTIEASCGLRCDFVPAQEQQGYANELSSQELSIKPYSVNMIILKSTKEPEKAPVVPVEELSAAANDSTAIPVDSKEEPASVP